MVRRLRAYRPSSAPTHPSTERLEATLLLESRAKDLVRQLLTSRLSRQESAVNATLGLTEQSNGPPEAIAAQILQLGHSLCWHHASSTIHLALALACLQIGNHTKAKLAIRCAHLNGNAQAQANALELRAFHLPLPPSPASAAVAYISAASKDPARFRSSQSAVFCSLDAASEPLLSKALFSCASPLVEATIPSFIREHEVRRLAGTWKPQQAGQRIATAQCRSAHLPRAARQLLAAYAQL